LVITRNLPPLCLELGETSKYASPYTNSTFRRSPSLNSFGYLILESEFNHILVPSVNVNKNCPPLGMVK